MIKKFKHNLLEIMTIFVIVTPLALSAADADISKSSPVEDSARIATLRDQLRNTPLPDKFDESAFTMTTNRQAVLDELYLLTDEDDIDAELEIARLYVESIRRFKTIRTSLHEIRTILLDIEKTILHDEKELKESFDKLDGAAVTQPFAQAQRGIDELVALDLSDIPLNHANILKKEIASLDRDVQDTDSEIELFKAKTLIRFVDQAADMARGRTFTEKLKNLEEAGRIIGLYVGRITEPKAANGVLERQLNILKETRKTEKERLKAYQKKALERFYEAISELERKHDKWAIRILEGLSEIDRSFLVPEMEELYQDLHGRAMNEYDKWVEEGSQFREKARFLEELSEREKWELESL